MRDDVRRQRRSACVSSSQNISEIKRPGKANRHDHKQDGSHGNKEPSPGVRAGVHGGPLLHKANNLAHCRIASVNAGLRRSPISASLLSIIRWRKQLEGNAFVLAFVQADGLAKSFVRFHEFGIAKIIVQVF